MKRARRQGGRGDHPGQLQIEWNTAPDGGRSRIEPPLPAPVAPALVQYLPWDFKTTFPMPTPQAMDVGIISDEDAQPENVKAIHDEHARELLITLNDLDAVLDARRRGVDPRNNKAPMLQEAKERLQKFFETEPGRLENWYANLLGVYEDAFGPEAAQAFDKAVRAWRAGIEVIDQTKKPIASLTPPTPPEKPLPEPAPAKISRRRNPNRIIARLPGPRPLPSAVAAGHFGQEENGKPVRPGAREVREITERHAEKLIDLLDSIHAGPMSGKEALQAQFNTGIAAYAEDFGRHAGKQLEAYVLRQAGLGSGRRHGR
jgi:hypothetical protein